MTQKLLEVRNLHVSFSLPKSKLHAVRGVSFHLNSEETLGIVGESGCGKSATAKALMQLNPRHTTTSSGEVLYCSENLLNLSERKMQRVRGKEMGMIFQDPMTSLNPTYSVGRQIVEGYRRHFPQIGFKEAKKIALELLKKVGIAEPEERFDTYPHTLSGGMRQRVMIALALACQPKILLADEPTTALDVTIQAQILHLLQQIQKEMKTSIVLITHDMSVVAKMCDRVLVMYAGNIVECGAVEDIFRSPQHPYTQKLLSAIPRLDQSKETPLSPILGTPPNLTHPVVGCTFCARCPQAMRICAKKEPPLQEIKHEHFAACFKLSGVVT